MTRYILDIPSGDFSLTEVIPPIVPKPLLGMRGCNLVGGATSWKNWSAAGPVYGKNYKFCSAAEVDALIGAGMNTFRILFGWEAISRTLGGPLDPLYSARLYELVDHITMVRGCNVVLDIHGDGDADFAAYRDVTVVNPAVAQALAELWRQIASKYKYNDRVMYGLTNEPHNISAPIWFSVAQRCITAIRSTGARQTIIVPGTDWTGAGSWTINNGPAWNLVDPLNNLQFQVHLYVDGDSGGKTRDIVSPTIGSDRIIKAIEWGRAKGIGLYLAEVAMDATNPAAKACWDNLYATMIANSDVVTGFAWWARGPNGWWDGYRFGLYRPDGPAPNMELIAGALK